MPALAGRVDPDAWLATVDQKMYLRHVGRDGCVDVDLQSYYIGTQVAKRAVLLQVMAESRQFAVWHEDQVIKLLPSPRAGRAGDGLGRLSTIHQTRGVGGSASFVGSGIQKSPAAISVGRGSLIPPFFRRLSRILASPSGKCGHSLASRPDQDAE